MADENKTPYLVHCVKNEEAGSCGESSYLTTEQYNQQMSNPDKGWRCPKCGSYSCDWDDDNYDDEMDKLRNRKERKP